MAVLELLPLNYHELKSQGEVAKAPIWDLLYQGSYPGPYHEQAMTDLWYKSYVTTYLQRDVRQLINIKNLSKFHLFLKLCAGRHGQLINYAEIGSACGVSHTTVAEWFTLLEISYIAFKVQPYYKNFHKRLVKTPKLYFYDSGLVCHLLGIESSEHAKLHASRGALFEGYIVSEVAKRDYVRAKTPSLYFWNAHGDFEIDLLIEQGDLVKAIEIKSSSTFTKTFLKQLYKWQEITQNKAQFLCKVVYAGKESFNLSGIDVVSYQDVETL